MTAQNGATTLKDYLDPRQLARLEKLARTPHDKRTEPLTGADVAVLGIMERPLSTDEMVIDPLYETAMAVLPPAPPRGHPMERAWAGLAHEALRVTWKEELARRNGLDEALRLERLEDGDLDPPTNILSPVLRDDEATTDFGDGGSGKSTVAAAKAVAIATDRHISAFEREGEKRPVIVVPYEARRGLKRRILSLAGDADTSLIRFVPPELMNGTLLEDSKNIAALIKAEFNDHGGPVGVLLVDSVTFAIGAASASDQEAATGYMRGLQIIGLPSINIAHQNRQGDESRPFGSTFWHNGSRMTWHNKRDETTGQLTLTCRKDNEGEMVGHRMNLRVEYNDAQHPSPIDIALVEGPRDSTAERMLTILSLTSEATAVALQVLMPDTTEKNIRQTAGRHPELFDMTDTKPTVISARVRRR